MGTVVGGLAGVSGDLDRPRRGRKDFAEDSQNLFSEISQLLRLVLCLLDVHFRELGTYLPELLGHARVI